MSKRAPSDDPTKASEGGLRVAQDRLAALFSGLAKSTTRRYTIEVRDAKSGKVAMITAVDWTSEQRRVGVAEICRAAGLPDDNEFVETDKH